MSDTPATAAEQGRLLGELAALQRAQPTGGAYLGEISFNGDGAQIAMATPERGRIASASVPAGASRAACHAALAAASLPPPAEGDAVGMPADETSPADAQFADLLRDLAVHADGLGYRGAVLRYDTIAFDGHRAVVTVAGEAGERYRSVFDFDRSTGPCIGTPYSIADWIGDRRGTPTPDGFWEMTLQP